MDYCLTREQFAVLPDRQHYAGVPGWGQRFRDAAYPGMVFVCRSEDHLHDPAWWAFNVHFDEEH